MAFTMATCNFFSVSPVSWISVMFRCLGETGFFDHFSEVCSDLGVT